MKYSIKNIVLFYVLIIFVCCNSLWSMLHQQDTEFLPNGTKLVLSILINQIDVLDHPTICSLAINKQCDIDLKKTAPKRKDMLLLKATIEYFKENSFVWHKYGSAYATIEQTGDSVQLSCRYFNAFRSFGTNKLQKSSLGFEKPFFDEQGNVCFYGLQKKQKPVYLGREGHIIKYCMPTGSGLLSEERLAVSIGPNAAYALSEFLSFPILLKAFLHTKKYPNGYFQSCKLSEIIIPSDYKTCVSCEESEYKKFDDLPLKLRNAIENRYQQQPKK